MRQSKGVVGIDIGGTKIRAAVISRDGTVGKAVTVPTGVDKGVGSVNKAIIDAIAAVAPTQIKAIGVGIAGSVDHKKGVYRHGPNFPKSYRNVALAAQLKKRFKTAVNIDNDVHCFTLAEATFGSARKYSRVIGLTVGTGIGGAIVQDGQIVRGPRNAVGEFGHMTVVAEDGLPCSCGLPGHLEAYASGRAISEIYGRSTGKKATATEVEDMAVVGGTEARRVLTQSAHMLAVGIANIVQTLDPDAVVIGGGLSKVDILMKPLLAAIPSFIAFPELRKTPIIRTKLGSDASVVGAALITGTL